MTNRLFIKVQIVRVTVTDLSRFMLTVYIGANKLKTLVYVLMDTRISGEG